VHLNTRGPPDRPHHSAHQCGHLVQYAVQQVKIHNRLPCHAQVNGPFDGRVDQERGGSPNAHRERHRSIGRLCGTQDLKGECASPP